VRLRFVVWVVYCALLYPGALMRVGEMDRSSQAGYHIPGHFLRGNVDLFMLEYLSTGALGYKYDIYERHGKHPVSDQFQR